MFEEELVDYYFKNGVSPRPVLGSSGRKPWKSHLRQARRGPE